MVSNSDRLWIGGPDFKGSLAEVRGYGFALDDEAVAQLAIDRTAGLTETPVRDYLQAAYEALLRGVGTSFEELRTLRVLTDRDREALAARLGIKD